MKNSPLFLLAALVAVFATACSHLDIAPESDPSRTLKGTVALRSDLVLPPDTIVVVRVIDTENREQPPGAKDLPVMERAMPMGSSERVLGQQTIKAPTTVPIPFQVEYTADDALLRRGLNVDVRISYGGRVQYRTGNAHVVTLSSANFPHELSVEPTSR